MAQLRKVFQEDFEFIRPLLLRFADSGFSEEKWKKLFQHYWSSTEEHIGYMLVDNDSAVGFIGTIYSVRKIKGVSHKICNLTSWIVLPDYRSESLLLLQQILKNKEYTITSFTSIPSAVKILARFGFRELDSHYYWYTPNNKNGSKNKIACITETIAIEKMLSDEEKKIFHDHIAFHANHYVFTDDQSYCYIITRKRNTSLRSLISNRYINYADFILRKMSGLSFLEKKRSLAHLCYFSNADFLFKNIEIVNKKISNYLHVSGLLVDARVAPARKRLNRHKTCPRISLYRPAGLKSSEIDSLYSEFFILDLQ
jgi:hypothetical protein